MKEDTDLLDEQTQLAPEITHRELWDWWADRRYKFNIVLFGTVVLFAFVFFASKLWLMLFLHPLSLLWFVLLNIIYLIVANIFYILGWWLEALLFLFTRHAIDHPFRRIFWYIVLGITIAPFIYLFIS